MSTHTPDDTKRSNVVSRFDSWLDDDVSPRRTLVVYAVLAVYFSILLFPILFMVISTLVGQDVLYSGKLLPSLDQLTLQNYFHVVTLAEFQTYFLNSTIVATATTLLTLVTGTLAGYSLSRFEYPGRQPILLTYLSTQMLPRVLILIPFFLLMFSLGLVDQLAGITLAHTIIALPFTTWLLKGYFDDIPKSLDESAKMDGCSELDVLLRIILPLSLPGITVAGFYTFIVSWNDFLFVSVLSQTTGTRTLPFGLQLFQSANTVNWELTLTASVITMVPVIVLFGIFQNWIVGGLASGGMKGS